MWCWTIPNKYKDASVPENEKNDYFYGKKKQSWRKWLCLVVKQSFEHSCKDCKVVSTAYAHMRLRVGDSQTKTPMWRWLDIPEDKHVLCDGRVEEGMVWFKEAWAGFCGTNRSSWVLQLSLKRHKEPQQGLIAVTSDLLCQRITLVTMREEEKSDWLRRKHSYPGQTTFCKN